MVATAVVMMLNDVVDIIVDFCRIVVELPRLGRCNFNYLCPLLYHMTFKD